MRELIFTTFWCENKKVIYLQAGKKENSPRKFSVLACI